MTESPTALNEPSLQSDKPKNNNRTTLYIILGVAALCCLCCAAVLAGQYFLEHSNFSLVNAGSLHI